ncbi:MAG: 16S rRNA (uracil(1498)-N(3))-methyltransferase [Deltaproteobacteria bacterium]|nr:16S rRNA (uracil(1498)-N(3))-methyltransferase [Deltaproteobacteria bacterium]
MSNFAYTEAINSHKAIFTGDEFRHQISVLRRRVGDHIDFLDGRGKSYQGRIAAVDNLKNELQVEITKSETFTQPLPLQLLVALPKSGKLDAIVQKAVELGVSRITPLLTSRTVVRIDSQEKIKKKCRHWQHIAIASLKQSGNLYLPQIDQPTALNDLDENYKDETLFVDKIVFHPRAPDALAAKEWNLKKNAATRLALGPEGGFDDNEIDFLRSRNYMVISLGKRIMRLETAVVSALTIVQFLKNNI